MIGVLVGGLLLWGVVFALIDRPSRAVWQVRNAYRVALAVVCILLVVVGFKAEAYRQELRFQIRICP